MWQIVANLNELKEKKMLRIEVETSAILLTYHNDHVFAMSDKCPHMGASLAKGTLANGIVTCASHHAQIDVTNGKLVSNPKILFMKMPSKNAKTYQVKVEENNILIEL